MDYEQKLKEIVMNDVRFISLLKAVEELHLPDSWICAGCLRNKIWDELDSISTPMNDIDVIYFDEANTSKAREKRLESQLQVFIPSEPWSVKNQARMHEKNGSTPYQSSFDGVANFPETATAVAIRITNNELEVMAPYGLQDLFSKSVRPTPHYDKTSDLHSVYLERVSQKKWDELWSHVFVER
ncbi:nucleotidyltransferase family protein [Sporosarcina gallistercoris]|uniref:Nucleotidyltransferase family protein n=1 Tax=Sporosarcina gallistercoris TaxID=2762245 RepID=A0ABR8PEW0_9BACL|nr:nucleotidyltransferase family protein [Sporosarcina gallistercoris]MBD7906710.1 nucleotidyltransferase family protein [Sporosarcina gallistercoris]